MAGRSAMFLLFGSLSVFLTVIQAKERVPVLIWTSESSTFPPVLAGHTINKDDFEKEYLADLKTNIVVFVQDKLSLSDITFHGSVYGVDEESDDFKHLKEIMFDHHSTFLPRVIGPVSTIDHLQKRLNLKVHKLKSPSFQLAGLALDSNRQNLIIVDLPKLHGDKSVVHIDTILDSVTTQMKALQKPFTAIYTAKQSRENHDLHQGRHLLSISENFPPITNKVNFLMYTENITLNEHNILPTDVHVDQNLDGCSKLATGVTNCSLVLNITTKDLPIQDISLTMTFTQSVGYWYVSQMLMSYTNVTKQESLLSTSGIDPTPLGYSYHCHQQPAFTSKNLTAGSSKVSISFSSFQIQMFMNNGTDKFGFYNDCIGFFTIPIWMFIICTAIMLAILFFGIIMLSSITTMDRYDDPKGKTISITATD
jgi:V-type H+-transporting ATPase S1 subunit